MQPSLASRHTLSCFLQSTMSKPKEKKKSKEKDTFHEVSKTLTNASVFAMNLGDKRKDNKIEPIDSQVTSTSKDSTQSYIIHGPQSGWASGSSSGSSSGNTDSMISITIFGLNITSKAGIALYKFLAILVPLIPTFFLIIYNAIQLEGIVTRSNLLDTMFAKQIDATKLTLLASKLQDERYNVIFTILMNRYVPSRDLSEELEVNYAETDATINKLDPWRDDIPVKVFASRIRFQIRLDDIRDMVKNNQTTIDQALEYYNEVIDALLTRYSKEVRIITGSKAWKQGIVYKNILRAIDNIGINSAYVSKYYLRGKLNDDEMVDYLKSQILSLEYLNQASNFNVEVRRMIQLIQEGSNYKKLYEIWDDVEDETTTVDTDNPEEVRQFSINLYRYSLAYLDDIRDIEARQLKKLRDASQVDNVAARWSLYYTLALIIVVLLFLSPLLVFMNIKTTLAGEAFIEALGRRSKRITKEQKRNERLVMKLLPPVVIERLKETKEVSFSYDAVTILFCSLYRFSDIIQDMNPMDSFRLLNEIYTIFDRNIEKYDVYKVESINEKYMVASGVPKPNGNRHVDEIARLALTFLRQMRIMREESSRFPEIYVRMGIHSGNTVAGVIGSKMPRFCLFGETINLASRMETNGEPRKIQISSTTKTLLDLTEAGSFVTKARGPIHIKGKGFIETFWLMGRRFNRQKTLKQTSSKEESQAKDENEVEESMEDSLDVMHAGQKSSASSIKTQLQTSDILVLDVMQAAQKSSASSIKTQYKNNEDQEIEA